MNRRWIAVGMLIALAMIGLLTPSAALAATKTWTGASSPSWSDRGNWGGALPLDGDDLVFPGGAGNLTNVNDLPLGTSFNSITISGDGYEISGNAIALGSGGITSSVGSSERDTLDLTVALSSGTSTPIAVTNSGATLILGGALSGPGGVTKTGLGSVRFDGAAPNTYAGATTVNQGALLLNRTAGVTTIPGTLTIGDGVGAANADGVTLLRSNQIADTAAVTIASSGLLNLRGASDAVGSLAGAGNVLLSLSSAASTLTVGGDNASTSFSGVIGDNTSALPGNLVKTGTGTLILSGSNTYAGTTTVSAGTLQISQANALGGAGATVQTGATLAVANGITVAKPLTLNGSGVGGGGALINADNALSIWAGGITLASTSTVGVRSGTFLVLTGVIGGSGGLTKVGTGSLQLAGSNTYTGETIVQTGTITILDSAALGSVGAGTTVQNGARLAMGQSVTVAEPLTLNGSGAGGAGALRHADATVTTWSGAIVLQTTSAVSGVTGSSLTLSGVISGAGGLTKLGPGTLRFSGSASNTYTGPTTVNEGTLELAKSGGAQAMVGPLIIGDGTGGANADVVRLVSSSSILTSVAVTVNSSGLLDLNDFGAVIGSLAGDGHVSLGSGTLTTGFDNTSTTFSGVLSGVGGTLDKVNAGTFRLTGGASNTYSGLTIVDGGTIELGKPDGVPAIPGNLAILGGSVRLLANDQIGDSAPITVSRALFDLNGFSETIGSLSLTNEQFGGARITTGAGTLTLGGNVSTQNGIFGSGAVGATISGRINLGSATRTFTVTDGTAAVDVDISAVISGGPGVGLTKSGAGTLSLSGSNSYGGPTAVQAGTLLVTGALTNSAVTLTGGTLGGTGAVKGITATGGTVSPGTSPGRLSSTGNVLLGASSSFAVELNGATAGTQYDQLSVTGTVSLSGATLNATLGFAPAVGDQFTIIQNDGTDPVQGTFAGLADGATLAIGGQGFQISYKGGDGNDVVLTRVAPCTVRPNVRLPVQPASNGRLQVTVHAGADPATNGLVQSLQFTKLTNAVIEIEGQVGITGTYTLPTPAPSLTFFVRRGAQGTGQGSTAEFTVTDTCGTWQTFAGGGPNAF